MKGAYEFKVVIEPDCWNPDKLNINAKCTLMKSVKKGYLLNSSFSCDPKNRKQVIQDHLIAVCRWLDGRIEEDEGCCNAVASKDSGTVE